MTTPSQLVRLSTIPVAIDGLLAALRVAAPAAVKVVDGFPRWTITKDDLIAVGGKPEPTAFGRWFDMVEGTFPVVSPRMEEYFLSVSCSSSRGVSVPQKDVRDRAFALAQLVDDAVQSDPTLGGVVRSARLVGEVSLTQTSEVNATAGVFAEVVFPVVISASL